MVGFLPGHSLIDVLFHFILELLVKEAPGASLLVGRFGIVLYLIQSCYDPITGKMDNPDPQDTPGAAGAEDVTLSIAVPFYNEELVVDFFFNTLVPLLEQVTPRYEIVCVNDGSTDNTWKRLREYGEKDSRIRPIDLSRNFGKEAALTCALDHCRGAAVIPIDADLQDPPQLIPDMVDKWREGFEVVLARRRSRSADSGAKRMTAHTFYKVFNWVSDISIPEHVGDFRLMDRKVVQAMRQMNEQNRFMKGLFAWIGFKTCTLEFDRDKRVAGATKWKKWKLWNFALDGIFAFSVLPLKIWIYFGGIVSLFSFLYGTLLIFLTILFGRDIPGYASLMVVMLFLGGIQLIGLGVLGEYLGRVYKEVKRRPIYLVRERA